MALYLGNKGISDLYLGADRVTEAYLGNKLVYSSDKYIYRHGALMQGVTLNSFTNEPEGELSLEIYGGWGSGPFARLKPGYVQFDVTNYSKIIVRGRTWCYGYISGEQGNPFGKTIGLDVSSISLPQGYRGWTGDAGEPATFEVELPVGVATGQHRVQFNMLCRNESSNWLPALNTIRITEIIGEH